MKPKIHAAVKAASGVALVLTSTLSNASIYLSGTDGGGITVIANAPPQFQHATIPNPKGIVTSYSQTFGYQSTGSGSFNQSLATATINYSANASSLGFIPNGTTGVFNLSMFGNVSTQPFVNDAAVSDDVFGVFFQVDSYYKYNIDLAFEKLESPGTARVTLSNTGSASNIFTSVSNAAQTTNGTFSGVLSPGAYLFESSILLSVAAAPDAPLFDFNRTTSALTLTPMASPVPEPEALLEAAVGLAFLAVWGRMRRPNGQ